VTGPATGNGNTGADPEILVAIGGLSGASSSLGLKHPTLTNYRIITSSAHGTSGNIVFDVSWDESVTYTAGTAGTFVVVSTGTNITCTATHIDDVAITTGLQGNTVRFTGTTVDEAATLSIADDTAIGDPDLYDALGAQAALSTASKTITAAVKTASGYSTRAVTT